MKGKLAFLLCIGMSLAGCTMNQVVESQPQNSPTMNAENEPTVSASSEEKEMIEEEKSTVIQVENNGNVILFELNDSTAAQSLVEQLPLTVENEDFSNNEKTFYPPQKLDVSDAPHTDGSVGTLAYYEPWGDVVLFYGSYNPNGSLYELGKVIQGSELISSIQGEMTITIVE